MIGQEIREFYNFIFNPREAISSSRIQTGPLNVLLRSYVVLLIFIFFNISLMAIQLVNEPLSEVNIDHFLIVVRDISLQLVILLTSIVFGYLFALILLSKTAGLLQSLRTLLYAGGGFLVMYQSAEVAMPDRYWVVLNTIRHEVLSLSGILSIIGSHDFVTMRDHGLWGPGWDFTTHLLAEGASPERNVVDVHSSELASYVYESPPLIELISSGMYTLIFLIWIFSAGYFIYLIYLDARINHDLSQTDALFVLGLTHIAHVLEMELLINPARNLLYGEYMDRIPREVAVSMIDAIIIVL